MGRRYPLAALVTFAIVAAASGGGKPATPTADPLAGRYTSSGGGGALAAVQALTKRFQELHPGVVMQVEETGSDAGINLAAAGSIDFGFVSRALTADENAKLSTVNIGLAGTGIVVNAANPLKDLTKDQVRKIFSGEIANWSQLGWENEDIKVIIRESNAATRTNFESYFFSGKPTYAKSSSEVFDLDQTLKTVGSFRASIGMATASNRTMSEPLVHLVSVDGIAPSPENLVNGSYKIGRPLLIVYPNDESRVKPGMKAFIDFVKSPEGQKIAAASN